MSTDFTPHDIGRQVATQMVREFQPFTDNVQHLLEQNRRLLFEMTSQMGTIQQINEEIRNLQAQTAREVSALKRMTLARAQAQRQLAEENMAWVSGEVDEKRYELDVQLRDIQQDYDKTQMEFIGNFVESVSADTRSIDEIKAEYRGLSRMMQQAAVDSSALGQLSLRSYRTRLLAIQRARTQAQDNFKSFLAARKKTIDHIDKLQNIVASPTPLEILVPFWVIGLSDYRSSNTRQIILPIQEVMDSGGPVTRESPYASHIRAYPRFDMSGMVPLLSGPEIEKMARAHSAIQNVTMESLERIKKCFDDSELDGTSLFLNTLKKFIFER